MPTYTAEYLDAVDETFVIDGWELSATVNCLVLCEMTDVNGKLSHDNSFQLEDFEVINIRVFNEMGDWLLLDALSIPWKIRKELNQACYKQIITMAENETNWTEVRL
jgi:hypothetical protein